MQTYSVQSIPTQLPLMLKKVANGEEILLTDKEKPVAKLVPPSSESYRERVRAMRGFLKGIDTDVEAEDDPA